MLILIVEDDPRVARFLSRGLEEEGYGVDLCVRGDEALNQAFAHPYELILLDWSLPGQDGLSLLRAWRSQGLQAPILMLTARDQIDAVVLALDAGADDYLTKPFRFSELIARIRALLRRSRLTTEGARVRIGELALDAGSRTLHHPDGSTESLSGREYELLALLLRFRGEVLSRTQILDRVWGLDFDPGSNVVDVYIRYLRTKLDPPDAPASCIETVRGQGYRLRLQEPT